MTINLEHLLQALRVSAIECGSLLSDKPTIAPSLADVLELRETLKKHQILLDHAAQVVAMQLNTTQVFTFT